MQKSNAYAGFHQFRDEIDGSKYGQFCVLDWSYTKWLNAQTVGDTCAPAEPGWYWQAEWPGYLPDSDMFGPFDNAHDAYYDAQGTC